MEDGINGLNCLLERIPRLGLVALCITAVFLLGLVDHLTGYEVSLAFLYLLPVGIAAWYGNRKLGHVISLLSAGVWFVVDLSAGHEYSSSVVPFWNAAVRFGIFATIAHLIASQHLLLNRESESARLDPLTGVRNSRGFFSDAGLLWSLAERHKHITSLAYIDLDDLKRVNDEHGHAEGDAAIIATAKCMSESLRRTDILARIGGDEFVALLPETPREGAEKVFQAVKEKLSRKATERRWSITVSIGVLVIHPPYMPLPEALRKVDTLMYSAKHEGKDMIIISELHGEA